MATKTKTKTPPRTTLLLLSGGLDSTTCLFKLLTETDDDVHTFYIDVENNLRKAWCEKEALRHIKEVASGIREFTHHPSSTVSIMGTNDNSIQPLMWMLFSAMMLNSIPGTKKRLCIGYTDGDSTTDTIVEFTDHWEYLWDWIADGRCPPLYLPLLKRTKMQSMDYLRRMEYERKVSIVKNLWTCEEPVLSNSPDVTGYSACKQCHPCKRGIEIGLVRP